MQGPLPIARKLAMVWPLELAAKIRASKHLFYSSLFIFDWRQQRINQGIKNFPS
jgi:hypothetical protein